MKKNNLRSQGVKETSRQDISLDDIVSVARELRDEENAQLQVAPIVDSSQFTVDSSFVGGDLKFVGGDLKFVGGDLKSPTPEMRISNPHQQVPNPHQQPSNPHQHGQSRKVRLWLAAACLVGFLFGFGLRPTVSSLLSQGAEESGSQGATPLASVPESGSQGATPLASVPYAATASQPSPRADTILLREVVHDTVFQTRVIIRNAAPHPVVAQAENAPATQEDASRQQAETSQEAAPAVGCSMLCDDIPYAILARN